LIAICSLGSFQSSLTCFSFGTFDVEVTNDVHEEKNQGSIAAVEPCPLQDGQERNRSYTCTPLRSTRIEVAPAAQAERHRIVELWLPIENSPFVGGRVAILVAQLA
jgi:hypothetical protein